MRHLLVLATLASTVACGSQRPNGATTEEADPRAISRTDTVRISLLNDGRLLFGEEETTTDELGMRLEEMDPAPILTVWVDTELSYADARDLLQDLREVLIPGQVVGVTDVYRTK